MLTVTLHHRTYQVPTCYNQLTRRQYLQVTKLLYNNNIGAERLMLSLFKTILGIGRLRWLRIPTAAIDELLYLTHFLFLPDENPLTTNLLPRYGHRYGPANGIENVTMKEMVFAEHYYQQWQANRQNINQLNQFVACLYRPAKYGYNHLLNKDGDCRQPFKEFVAEYETRFIARWPLHVKYAIANWYASCRSKMVADNADLFGNSNEPSMFGLIGLIRDIAKEGTFGNFTEVEGKTISLIMVEMQQMAHAARLAKQNTPTQTAA